MTLIVSTRLAIPTQPTNGEQLSRHLRLDAALRFREPIWAIPRRNRERVNRAGDRR
jgi:hypothetical protein